jgi:hypothetical protein
MRIYAALSWNTEHDSPALEAISYPYVLASYVTTGDGPETMNYRPSLILDSGAFSVWSAGNEVDLAGYIIWALALRASYGAEVQVTNLDVIPGEPGAGPPSRKERERAARQGQENADAMREAGLPVIEVYHRFEPPRVLDELLERRRPGEVLGIGGLVGRLGGPREKRTFCDSVFARIREHAGGWEGIVPCHGFGVSGDAPLARRYPWFSVDSTTWFTMRNFNIHVERGGGFKPRDRETSPRTTKAQSAIHAQRRLRRWLRDADSLSRLWDERGVTFCDTPEVVPA